VLSTIRAYVLHANAKEKEKRGRVFELDIPNIYSCRYLQGVLISRVMRQALSKKLCHPIVIVMLVGLLLQFSIAGCSQSTASKTSIKDARQYLQDLDRGRYVIVVMGCNDCHTPNYIIKRGDIPEDDWLVGNTFGFKNSNGTSYPTNLRLLVNGLSEEDWLEIAQQMRSETPMADVMLPETEENDLRSIYKFIKYLGPKGVKAPRTLPGGVTPASQYILYPEPH
jgi:hypothetical protein